MCKVVIALVALGICLLGRQMAQPVEIPVIPIGVTSEDANVTIVPVVARPPSGLLDSLWVSQDMVSPREEYQLYRDDGIFYMNQSQNGDARWHERHEG
jgi:hypothetical protein